MHKQMKSVSVLLLISLTVLASCKSGFELELCITGDDYKLVCSDPRLDKDKQKYTKNYTKNYVCTSPQDFDRILQIMADNKKQAKKWRRALAK